MINLPSNLIRLSQGDLKLLEICPPKFQQIYLEKISSFPNPELEEKQMWGSRFHLLMQQRELGLPLESLLEEERELDKSIKALINAAPDILVRDNNIRREAEHILTLNIDRYLLTVIYDLLIADKNHAQIIDWKTYPISEDKNKLANNWQTLLYLYVLAETSDYLPEQISMTYWFVKLPETPQSQTITYSQEKHQKTKETLQLLLKNLDIWLQENNTFNFPHRSKCQTDTCPYHSELVKNKILTKTNQESVSNLDLDETWLDSIEEVSID